MTSPSPKHSFFVYTCSRVFDNIFGLLWHCNLITGVRSIGYILSQVPCPQQCSLNDPELIMTSPGNRIDNNSGKGGIQEAS